MDDPPSLDEFLKSPIVYKGAFNHEISPAFPLAFKNIVKKGEGLRFRFESEGTIKDIEIQFYSAGDKKSYFPGINKDVQGLYYVDHIFKSKGTYDVHFLTEKDYLFTYNIKVVKN